jgi:Fur family transcriptional regulator, ferric uptake regulator
VGVSASQASSERAEWVERARRTLAEEGYRAGEARSAVIDVLGAEGGCITAEEIVSRLGRGGRTVGVASVYRALALLCELRLLQGTDIGEGSVRYELLGAKREHHHHLVCDHCGRTVPFEDRGLESAIEGVSRRVDYSVAVHEVTLRGSCPSCRRRAGVDS